MPLLDRSPNQLADAGGNGHRKRTPESNAQRGLANRRTASFRPDRAQ
jgi:hypothetical protein